MTDTTFFIDTRAAFEHAFEAGAFAEADADDYMYMHSDRAGSGGPNAWVDRFKHRDTRKYTSVRRTRFIEPSEPDTVQAVARGPEVSDNVQFTADVQALARHFQDKAVGRPAIPEEITEARAEFTRFEKVRDAAPQLLEALEAMVECEGRWPDGTSDNASNKAHAAIKAATQD